MMANASISVKSPEAPNDNMTKSDTNTSDHAQSKHAEGHDASPSAARAVRLLHDDPMLQQIRNKAERIGRDLCDEAGVERARELLQSAGLPCEIHDMSLFNSGRGFGFRVSTTRSLGHIVAHISEDGPAHDVLQKGDQLIAVNDRICLDLSHNAVVDRIRANGVASLMVARHEDASASAQTEAAELEPYKTKVSFNREHGAVLGMKVASQSDGERKQSVITECKPDGIADSAGLRKGDILTEINGVSMVNAEHSVVMTALRGAVGRVTIQVERHPTALRKRLTSRRPDRNPSEDSLENTTFGFGFPPSADASPAEQTSSSSTAHRSENGNGEADDGVADVPRRQASRQDQGKLWNRRETVYDPAVLALPRKPIFSRLRYNNSSGGASHGLPSSFAVSEMSGSDAETVLNGHPDGTFLFREAHGKIVLSMMHKGKVFNYVLQLSLAMPFKDLDRALRKFVKHYSSKRSARADIPCLLGDYLMSSTHLPAPNAPTPPTRPVVAHIHHDNDDDEHVRKDSVVDGVAFVEQRDAVGRKVTKRTGPSLMPPGMLQNGTRQPSSLAFASRSFEGESRVDGVRLSDGGRTDEDGLPMMSPTGAGSDMFAMGVVAKPTLSNDDVEVVLNRASMDVGSGALSPVAPKSTIAPSSLASNAVTSAASKTATDDAKKATPADGKPRRRKLVRGGNRHETPVLPEYSAAMLALDDLDSFLNKYEEMHNEYENMSGPKSQSSQKKGTLMTYLAPKKGSATLSREAKNSNNAPPSNAYVPRHAQEDKGASFASLMDGLY